MLELILNIAYTSVLLSFGVVTTKPVPPSELHDVVPFEGKPIAPLFSSKGDCRFYGLAVPYERDWEIVSENTMTHTKTMQPPEPGKIHSYAILVNKKTCPGKEPERMLIGGSSQSSPFMNLGIRERHKVMFTEISPDKEKQPKWLPQVMRVIEEAETTQPVVKDFLDYSRAGIPEVKPTPAPEVAAKAETTAAEPAEASPAN